MSLGFPSNPNVGDLYTTASGQTYQWDGFAWNIYSGASPTYPSITVTNITIINNGTVGGADIVTTATIYQYIAQSSGGTQIYAGTDTAVALVGTGTGVIVWNTSTLQTVTGRGNTTNQTIHITNVTTAFSTNTGALTVAGGVGIGKNLVVGGDIISSGTNYVQSLTSATSVDTGAVIIGGGLGVGQDVWIGGDLHVRGQFVLTTSSFFNQVVGGVDIQITGTNDQIFFNDVSTLQTVTSRGPTTNQKVFFNNNTESTSTNTGAVIVTRGMAVQGNLSIGQAIQFESSNIDSNQVVINTTAATVVDMYDSTRWRTSKYLMQIESGVGYNAAFESIEILLLVDNLGNIYSTEYAIVTTNGELGEFSADVQGDNMVRLYFTPKNPGTTIIKLLRTTVAW
jgi:hypothetical protein